MFAPTCALLVVLLALSACSSPSEQPIVISAVPDAGAGDVIMSGCGPTTCEGCCDDTDRCRLGVDDATCGAGGEACSDCQDSRCVDGVCRADGCGDARLGDFEACDGDLLGGSSCETLGFSGGLLACSDSCELDTSGCDSLTCAEAEAQGGPCDFCAPGAESATYCAFCRGPLIDGSPRQDMVISCPAGTSCYRWEDPDTGQYTVDCLDQAPETCSQAEAGRCENNVAVRCGFDGRLRQDDCSNYPGGQCVTFEDPLGTGTGSRCIDEDAVPCDPATHTPRCDGDQVVGCDLSGYESRGPCDLDGMGLICMEGGGEVGCFEPNSICQTQGVTCSPAGSVVDCRLELGGTVLIETVERDCAADGMICADTLAGPACRQPGTVACDPGAYVASCQGALIFECHNTYEWEQTQDCALDGMTCHDVPGVGPRCAPANYTACNWETTDPTCAGATGTQCRPFHPTDPARQGWLETFDCPALNPLCAVSGKFVGCVSSPETPCTPPIGDVEDRVEMGIALRCEGQHIVACDSLLLREFRFDCAGEGGNWICEEPMGVCTNDPCWCTRP